MGEAVPSIEAILREAIEQVLEEHQLSIERVHVSWIAFYGSRPQVLQISVEGEAQRNPVIREVPERET